MIPSILSKRMCIYTLANKVFGNLMVRCADGILMKNAFATALGNCSFLVLRFNKYVANVRRKMRQTTNIGWKILQSHVCFISACFLSGCQTRLCLPDRDRSAFTNNRVLAKLSRIIALFTQCNTQKCKRLSSSPKETTRIVILCRYSPRSFQYWPIVNRNRFNSSSFGTGGIGNDEPALHSLKKHSLAGRMFKEYHRHYRLPNLFSFPMIPNMSCVDVSNCKVTKKNTVVLERHEKL
ncbi:hypothetical protein T01_16254 [Trichinella spiralis]|uniref:Uncharacterized protein n=1 Tax=Trichinella spiralis TaxID=6334 RepID=A0A0V1C384_TRISP|nr:hypothetical protein T01_16254 [Trichinella spiralis]